MRTKNISNAFMSIPIKRMSYLYIFIGAIGLIMILRIVYSKTIPNSSFYKTTLIGKIDDIYSLPRSNSYRINGNWYLIKGECVDYMSKNDLFVKNGNSYTLKIVDSNKNVKYEKDVKYIIFMDVGSKIKPNIPFNQQ